jgi:hypothetical protein
MISRGARARIAAPRGHTSSMRGGTWRGGREERECAGQGRAGRPTGCPSAAPLPPRPSAPGGVQPSRATQGRGHAVLGTNGSDAANSRMWGRHERLPPPLARSSAASLGRAEVNAAERARESRSAPRHGVPYDGCARHRDGNLIQRRSRAGVVEGNRRAPRRRRKSKTRLGVRVTENGKQRQTKPLAGAPSSISLARGIGPDAFALVSASESSASAASARIASDCDVPRPACVLRSRAAALRGALRELGCAK